MYYFVSGLPLFWNFRKTNFSPFKMSNTNPQNKPKIAKYGGTPLFSPQNLNEQNGSERPNSHFIHNCEKCKIWLARSPTPSFWKASLWKKTSKPIHKSNKFIQELDWHSFSVHKFNFLGGYKFRRGRIKRKCSWHNTISHI